MQKQKAEVGKAYRSPLLPTLRSIDEKARTIEFVASTEKQDRYGDVIRVDGWKLDNYLRNPIFLWGHRSGEPPIGKCVDLRIETNPPALVQKVQFADAATYPFADTIFKLYAGRFLNAVSVGFMPLEMQPFVDLEGHMSGYEFLSQELLELSAVPIPANADCVARAVQKGFSESDLARVFFGEESASSEVEAYKALTATSLDLAEIAVDIATKVVQQALAKLKAQPNSVETEITLDQLRAAVKGAAASVQSDRVAGLEELAEALKPDQIETVEQLGAALGKQ